MSELEAVNRYILERVQEGSFDGDSAVSLLRKLNGVDPSKDIAIVGMSCRFPRADDYDEYWRNIINKVGVIGTFPEDRARDTGHAMKLKAGWLEHIGDFDAAFFRISPKEALSMHPEQRIFLEAAWTCLEDAGYCGPSVEGSNVGVFVGVDHSYPMDYVAHDAAHSLLDMTGSMSSVMASRIAFVLDLRGPNMVLDTACSSGLVAVHQACLSIRAGESDLAIAGGLHLLSDTDASFDGVESTSGVLASFDRNSQGTVWGEGLGLVVLKAADRAIADNDHIYAIIRGSAVNNDGRSNGITAPKASTQADVILRAWRDAGIDPEHLSYVEAHATGTVLGDPIEVDGLTTAFARHTSRKQFCALGSVKPNLGHGVSAASMSSLLKVLLAMRARKLPPNINFEEPNPYIAFHESPLYVSDVLQPWTPNGPRLLAAVSSFGFGRTNAHVVLEEAPAREVPADPAPAPDPDRLVFALSARTEAALWHYVRAVHDHLVDHPQLSPADVCFTLAVGRMQFEHRLAFEFAGRAELLARLAELSSPDRHLAGVHVGRHRVISANMIAQDAHDLTGTQQRALTAQAAALLTGDPLGAEARSDLCDLFVGGASVDWAATFSTPGLGRVPLPTYPFQRKHFWIEPEPESPTLVEPDALHPLVEKLLARSRSEDIYGTRFEVGKQWILTEHVINGHNVIPGTAFLEMMHAACAQTCGQPQLELTDVVFHASATVRPDEPLDVQITVRTVEGAFEIEILSEDPDLGWVTHATGRGIPLAATRPPTVLDPAITRARCDEVLPFDLSKEYGGFRFGPRWRNVTEIVYNSRQEIFTDLVMAEDFLADLDEYFLHPALLDNAINIGSEFLIQNVTHTMFLPFACKSIKIYAPLPQSFVSVQVIRNPIKNDMGAASIDVTLVDAAGRVILTLEKYSLKRVNHELFVNSVYHRVGFKGPRCLRPLSAAAPTRWPPPPSCSWPTNPTRGWSSRRPAASWRPSARRSSSRPPMPTSTWCSRHSAMTGWAPSSTPALSADGHPGRRRISPARSTPERTAWSAWRRRSPDASRPVSCRCSCSSTRSRRSVGTPTCRTPSAPAWVRSPRCCPPSTRDSRWGAWIRKPRSCHLSSMRSQRCRTAPSWSGEALIGMPRSSRRRNWRPSRPSRWRSGTLASTSSRAGSTGSPQRSSRASRRRSVTPGSPSSAGPRSRTTPPSGTRRPTPAPWQWRPALPGCARCASEGSTSTRSRVTWLTSTG